MNLQDLPIAPEGQLQILHLLGNNKRPFTFLKLAINSESHVLNNPHTTFKKCIHRSFATQGSEKV